MPNLKGKRKHKIYNIAKAQIMRKFHQAGNRVISEGAIEEAEKYYKKILRKVLKQSLVFAVNKGRKTINGSDIQNANKKYGYVNETRLN